MESLLQIFIGVRFVNSIRFTSFVFPESVKTFPHRIMTNTTKYYTATTARAELSTCHHYCALTNYTSSIVMRESLH